VTRSSRCTSPLRPSLHHFLSPLVSCPLLSSPLSRQAVARIAGGTDKVVSDPIFLLKFIVSHTSLPFPLLCFPSLLFSSSNLSVFSCLVLSCLLYVNLSSIISCLVWSSLLPLFFSSFHLIARPIYSLLRLPHLSMIVTLEVSILMHPAASSPF
jgi:hypothetical protein